MCVSPLTILVSITLSLLLAIVGQRVVRILDTYNTTQVRTCLEERHHVRVVCVCLIQLD